MSVAVASGKRTRTPEALLARTLKLAGAEVMTGGVASTPLPLRVMG